MGLCRPTGIWNLKSEIFLLRISNELETFCKDGGWWHSGMFREPYRDGVSEGSFSVKCSMSSWYAEPYIHSTHILEATKLYEKEKMMCTHLFFWGKGALLCFLNTTHVLDFRVHINLRIQYHFHFQKRKKKKQEIKWESPKSSWTFWTSWRPRKQRRPCNEHWHRDIKRRVPFGVPTIPHNLFFFHFMDSALSVSTEASP